MKVAIIGAGITGLYLAWKLSEKRHQVTVFEKKEKIGKEVCSGLFSERILEFIPESKKLIQNQIKNCLIHFPTKTLKIEFSRKFFVMNHAELDRLVASLAQKSGAEIILNSRLLKFDFKRLENKFERIIGCDGALSETRKFLELKNPEFYLGIQGFVSKFIDPLSTENAIAFSVDKSKKIEEEVVETWPTKSGFIWKISRENLEGPRPQIGAGIYKAGEIEYGIFEKPKEAREIFYDFLEKNTLPLFDKKSRWIKNQVKKKNIRLERIKSAIIPQGLIIPQNPKITLCGDAAGLTKPWSGGGVVWSLIAAEILLKNFPDFLKYKREVKKFFLPKITLGKLAKKIVYLLGFKIPWILPREFKIEGDFLFNSYIRKIPGPPPFAVFK